MRWIVPVGLLLAVGRCGTAHAPQGYEPSETRGGVETDEPDVMRQLGYEATEEPALYVNEAGSDLFVGERWKPCRVAADCSRVGTSCDGCCGEDAVATRHLDAYIAAWTRLCEPYEGSECDCMPLEAAVDCYEGLCTLQPALAAPHPDANSPRAAENHHRPVKPPERARGERARGERPTREG